MPAVISVDARPHDREAPGGVAATPDEPPPVFILVCKNTKLAKVLYDWLAEGWSSLEVPPSPLRQLQNENGAVRTIRVDSKVVTETDTEGAKSDEG